MPGRNCAFFGCSTSHKHKISLFQIPVVSAKLSEHTAAVKEKTRKEWLRIILRTREITPQLKERIDKNNLFVCELHFKKECILTDEDKPNSRKTLELGSVPTENLPKRQHETVPSTRRTLIRNAPAEQGELPSTSSDYSEPRLSLGELLEEIHGKDILPWKSELKGETLYFYLHDNVHAIPKYTIILESTLEFTAYVFNWPVPDNHQLYLKCKRSAKSGQQVKDLLTKLENSNICEGLTEDSNTKSIAVDANVEIIHPIPPRTVVRHTIPHTPPSEQFKVTLYYRSPECETIVETVTVCDPCSKVGKQVIKKVQKRKAKSSPAKSKASLTACGPEKLRATVVATRLKCKALEEQLEDMQKKINDQGVAIDRTLEQDILNIMDGQDLDATPHMKFFWHEQMKLIQSASLGRRYHPQIIRFALSIHGKSPSAYRELRDSGALVLPSERVLRDYKNYFTPKAGINTENVEVLRKKVATFSPVQKYVVLIMDEMKIQSDLVFDKNTGNLVGFIDLGDPMTNFAWLRRIPWLPMPWHFLLEV